MSEDRGALYVQQPDGTVVKIAEGVSIVDGISNEEAAANFARGLEIFNAAAQTMTLSVTASQKTMRAFAAMFSFNLAALTRKQSGGRKAEWFKRRDLARIARGRK